jgi:shikimate 5-dehydrogenase
VLDGAEMLVQQGARAFALWTARRPPVAVMRDALQSKISN